MLCFNYYFGQVQSDQPYNAIWCQSWYVPQNGVWGSGGCAGIHATCLIKNKKVAMLFVQTTGIFYPESQLGVCVFAADRHDTHMHVTLQHRVVISRSVNYFKEEKKGSLILLN